MCAAIYKITNALSHFSFGRRGRQLAAHLHAEPFYEKKTATMRLVMMSGGQLLQAGSHSSYRKRDASTVWT